MHLFGSPEALTQLLQRISQASGAELSYRTETGRFEAFGTEQAVHTAYQILSGIPVLKVSCVSIDDIAMDINKSLSIRCTIP